MKRDKIKSIPKYMIERIRKIDLKKYPAQDGFNRYYAYLTKNDGELVKVTVAVKNRFKKWFCKPVVVHGVHSDICYGQDMYCYFIAGYVVKWHPDDYIQTQRPVDPDEWGSAQDRLFDPYAIVINREYAVEKFPEYRYSALEKSNTQDVLKYLRLYEKFPQIEYLTKMGLDEFAFSKMILSKLKKDKKFVKWIVNNRTNIAHRGYYVSTILKSFGSGKPLDEMQTFLRIKKAFKKEDNYPQLKEMFNNELEKFFSYLSEQNISFRLYSDYLTACLELGIDMNDDKNRYPHDFKRWHDIRIDEYTTAKALKDKKEKEELYQKFAAVAEKYLAMQKSKDGYAIIIAHSPSDLIREGENLHHCVGRMGYDQKFVREETLIFFVRQTKNLSKPFVTIEYSLKTNNILQCYAAYNNKPDDSVIDYLNNKWLPYANRQIKKITAAA